MPTTTNPVSSVPVSNASQSKSLRSRLGLGGNTSKPSFFTQLNLKPSRRSFTMQPENQSQDKTVLLISTGASNEGSRSMTMHNPVKSGFNSLSKATTLQSRIPQRKVTHDSVNVDLSSTLFQTSRIQLNTPVANSQSVTFPKAQINVNPNDSATSKDLPNLSNELSLLVNESCPSGTTSHKNSQESVIHIGAYSKDITSDAPQYHPPPSSSSVLTSTETSEFRPHEFGVDDSFDLSGARISLESMKEELKGQWSQSSVVQDTSLSSADTSAPSLDISDASLYHNRSGPITSTPFVSRKASPSQIQSDLSFDLDTLDPDLVALLRPNSFQQGLNCVSTPVEKRGSQSANLPALSTSTKSAANGLESPPASPSHLKYDMDSSTSRRFSKTISMLPSPSSPSRPAHPPSRFQISQQTPALSHAPKPTIALNRIPWLDSPESEGGQASSGPSTVSSSNLATPLDNFKPPNPLVTTHSTISIDQQYRPEPFVVSRSSFNISKNDKTQASIHSNLSSPVDHRPNPRFALKNIDVQLASSLPSNEPSDDIRMSKAYIRNQTLDAVRSESARPSSADSSHLSRSRGNSSAGIPSNNERSVFESRRYRKRSMSVDQSPDLSQLLRHNSSGTTQGSWNKPTSARQFTYGGKSPDNEDYGRRGSFDIGSGERQARLSPEWLGPRTVKAFAAAGLLYEGEKSDRHISHSRSVSEYRASATNRDRFIADGYSSVENERDRDRDALRYSSSNRFTDYRMSGMRSGAGTPNVISHSSSRPLSRADSLSNSRQAPLFMRTISDLVSGRGSMEGRDSSGSYQYQRTTSGYSMTGGTRSESTGSGGRLSPTTSSSHITVQSQLQSLKEKYDSQTEALLAALADSQKNCRELRAENGSLKSQVKELEDRLIDAITTVKQKEKELARARRLYANDRSRTTNGRTTTTNHLQSQPLPSRHLQASGTARGVSPPKARRFSNGSSIFPTIPNTMALLMAETPDVASASSPPPGSSGSGTSPPPSPTLVLPKLTPESNVVKKVDNRITSSPIAITHRRSTSGASLATSANFSLKSGSPGSLKLKPEHEFLLGDLTQISLLTGSGTESEVDR